MPLIRRLAWFAGSLLLASLLIFAATNLLPGDIANVLLGTNATPEDVEALRQELGLNRPFLARYAEWLGGVLVGDFGTSMISGRSVTATVLPALGVSGWLVGLATVGSLAIALPVGAFAAVRRRHVDGITVSALSQIGLAVPAFWAGIWLVVLFSVHLGWLPAGGYVPITQSAGQWAAHLVLPVAALSIVQASVMSRYVRSAVIEVLHTDYFRTARAVGWGKLGALWRHGMRNISISLLTVIGLQIATLLVGAIIIEQVFALPGLGSKLLYAVTQRDLVVVQGIVLLLVWAVLFINFIVDVTYQAIDPRLKREA
ncbi:ABC transporter permease [uncultured Tessaracoccus sp.]|uniref:ABC transporter permease n=1 Tax=uncultured Tessaracoccus sp. TaxID=905023 RepID=UPI00260501AB|nr:ABC transporter permease [uncultured Tessaracoccus sp.]